MEKTTRTDISVVGFYGSGSSAVIDFLRDSIKNTQTFLMNYTTNNKAKEIEKIIPQCIYNFPYEIVTSYDEIFDDCKEANVNRHKKGGKK